MLLNLGKKANKKQLNGQCLEKIFWVKFTNVSYKDDETNTMQYNVT